MIKETSLFTSIQLGQTTLSNRVSVAPMTRTSATPDGFVTDQMLSYYKSFAEGGFGLIITEGLYPDDQHSQGYLDQPGLALDEQAEAWGKVVDAVHVAGAKIFAQIMHAGALSQGNRFTAQSIGPSAVQPKGEQMEFYGGKGPFPLPKEMSRQEIDKVKNGFVEAAKRAQSAGFDGVEIHGANGYILDQFLTDYTNKRTDEYGGSAENRVRLLVEVSEAIRAAAGPSFTVGIRISQGKVNDYEHKWAGKEKDAEVIFRALGKAGLDFIHVTEYEAWQPAFPGMDAGDSAFGEGSKSLAALAKQFSALPVIANGKLDDPETAARLLETGEADVISIGKGALANHDWVRKVQSGEPLAEFEAEKFLSPDAKLKDFEG